MVHYPAYTSEYVRNGNAQINWAIILNTRDAAGNINSAVDNLVWNVLPSINSWPSFDLFNTTSIENLSNHAIITVSPNPTKDRINFSVNVNMQLSNISGQIIAEEKNINTFDLSDQPSGLYFLTITDGYGNILQRNKIVKE